MKFHLARALVLLGLLAVPSWAKFSSPSPAIPPNAPARLALTPARPALQADVKPAELGIEAAFTADNSYLLGVGNGSMTTVINSACNNMSPDQIFSCGSGPECVTSGLSLFTFVYVVAWGDDSQTSGVLGQIRRIPSGSIEFTGTNKWQVYATGLDYDGCTAPDLALINAQIALANSASGAPGSTSIGWVGTTPLPGREGVLEIGELNNAVTPDFTCHNNFPQVCTSGPCSISPQAHWMWYRRPGSTCAFRDGDQREFLIFRLRMPKPKQRNLYVSSSSTAEIMRYDGITGAPLPSGNNTGARFVPFGVGGPMDPMGLAFGPDKRLYVSNAARSSVMRFSSDGTPCGAGVTCNTSNATFVSDFSGGLSQPHGLKFGPALDLYVASNGVTNGVLRFSGLSGSFTGVHTWGSNQFPWGLSFGGSGLYVTSFADLLGYPTLGGNAPATLAVDSQAVTHYDVAVGPLGDLFVTAWESNSVLRYSSGTYTTFIANGYGGLVNPSGLVFGPGPSPSLYVSSTGTHKILRYNGNTGAFQGVFASGGGLLSPTYLTFGPME